MGSINHFGISIQYNTIKVWQKIELIVITMLCIEINLFKARVCSMKELVCSVLLQVVYSYVV